MSPKLLSMIKNQELPKEQITKDIASGMIVAIIALPLSIALAISSGLTPEKGLITAIIAGLAISILGGSKVQIGGPTATFVVIIYEVVQKHGMSGLIISTMLAGIILIIMGLLKFGTLIKYVPKTITVGFTSGIAVTLLITQFKDLFGLDITKLPTQSIKKIETYIANLETFDILTFGVGILCIILMLLWPKFNKKIPGSIIALVVASVLVKVFNMEIDTIGSIHFEIVSSIPIPKIPKINMDIIKELIEPSFTIAILAAIQALLSCAVADEMLGEKHDSNTELIAQGIGNIGSALFGGMPATGAVARTVLNVKNSGRSPISGIVHCLTLLFVMMFMTSFTKLIPMTVLSSILIIVSFNMGDWKGMKDMMSLHITDVIVLLSTFTLTIMFDLITAISVGMILHIIFIYVRKLQYKAYNMKVEEAI
ncbi:MAG: SulP family inorganic anion transporter [Romboutsia sp.]